MKLRHLVLGLTLIGAGTAVSFAADAAPAAGAAATTQSAPATPATPPADAQTPATPAAPATSETPAATPQPDPNEKICKKDEVTGSRLAKICKTRKEWDEQAKGGGNDF